MPPVDKCEEDCNSAYYAAEKRCREVHEDCRHNDGPDTAKCDEELRRCLMAAEFDLDRCIEKCRDDMIAERVQGNGSAT